MSASKTTAAKTPVAKAAAAKTPVQKTGAEKAPAKKKVVAKAKPVAGAEAKVETKTVARTAKPTTKPPTKAATKKSAAAKAAPAEAPAEKPAKKPAAPRRGNDNALVVVESPAKAKTIKKYLGAGYTVKASVGHVKDLPKKKLGVDIEHGFEPEYVVIDGKEKVLAEIKQGRGERRRSLPRARPRSRRRGDRLAHRRGDHGRRTRNIQRVLFNEITKKAITEAIEHADASSTATSSRRSRRAASSTAWSATRSARCCGTRSGAGCRRAACSRSRCA